jgi:hypothetical protein
VTTADLLALLPAFGRRAVLVNNLTRAGSVEAVKTASRVVVLAALAVLIALSAVAPARAQVTGHVSVMADVLPDPDPQAGRQGVVEARVRLFAERRDEPGAHVRLVLSGYVDGLAVRHRDGQATVHDAIARPADLYVELTWPKVEVRLGASRIVWGRLDEFQPTDVVNPLDLSKFLLEGRSEARLSVGVARARFFLPGTTTLEAIAVPGFRRGRFDQLDEPTSPFNLGATDPGLVDRREPTFGTDSLQGGVRLTSTAGRVDWGASVYRGIRGFPTVTARVVPAVPDPTGVLAPPPYFVETYPRFTMVGGDFESVRGAWGVRGELAYFVRDELQSAVLLRGVRGRSVEGGAGVDRKAGDYRLAGNVLVSHRAASGADALARAENEDTLNGTDVTLVVAADRSFARETRTLRVFAVNNPEKGTTFLRAIGAVNLRDNVWLELSGGLFSGTSADTIGRLTDRDFIYARLKVYF